MKAVVYCMKILCIYYLSHFGTFHTAREILIFVNRKIGQRKITDKLFQNLIRAELLSSKPLDFGVRTYEFTTSHKS